MVEGSKPDGVEARTDGIPTFDDEGDRVLGSAKAMTVW